MQIILLIVPDEYFKSAINPWVQHPNLSGWSPFAFIIRVIRENLSGSWRISGQIPKNSPAFYDLRDYRIFRIFETYY